MSILNKVSKVLLALAFTFGLTGSITALAATTPSLGVASTFGILADTFTATIANTAITGDLGYTTLSTPLFFTVSGNTYIGGGVGDATYQQAGLDQATALTNLNTQACTPIAGFLNAVIINGNAPGVFPPGCYEITGAMDIVVSTTVFLDLTPPNPNLGLGSGGSTWIFRAAGGGFTTGADSIVSLINGANPCNVFWVPTGATSFGANTIFEGTVIDAAGISIGDNVLWTDGRALAFGGTVTTNNDDITVPTGCVAAPVGGRRRPVAVPPLIDITKVPNPLALPLGPATTTYNYNVSNIGTIPMSNITVNDNMCTTTTYISGDINNDLQLDLTEIWRYSCTTRLATTTTNTVIATGDANGFTAIDTAIATVVVGIPVIPPLIHVVKIPNIFLLPVGGGPVTYNYTVTNPGTAPLSNVFITDDKCTGLPGRVLGHPGDLNQNNLLESNESWSFTCLTNITDTITNIATASGSANGFTAVDYALATVVVAIPILPNTGLSPFGESAAWDLAIFLAIIALALIFTTRHYSSKKRKA